MPRMYPGKMVWYCGMGDCSAAELGGGESWLERIGLYREDIWPWDCAWGRAYGW